MQTKFFSAAILSLAFIFTQNAFAAMPPKPTKCPGATSIASGGIDLVQRDQDGTWIAALQSNKYDTNDTWTFALGKIPANDESEAREKALESLDSLNFRRGPIAIEQYNVWACLYSTEQGFIGVTINPAVGVKSAAQLLQ